MPKFPIRINALESAKQKEKVRPKDHIYPFFWSQEPKILKRNGGKPQWYQRYSDRLFLSELFLVLTENGFEKINIVTMYVHMRRLPRVVGY